MECALHIAYRDIEGFRNNRADTPEKKERMKIRKTEIISKFKSEMGLIIDVPKSGSGTTNDGNTARRFFENPAKTAEIVGLKPELIDRFAVVLQTINSGFHINETSFRNYCLDTAKFYVQHYNWYFMPPTVHKILLHGADIIASLKVPVGTLSEEPQECRNKDIKKFRENRARKTSR